MFITNQPDVTGEKVVIQPESQDGQLQSNDVKMFEVLFQHLLDIYFYIKDINGRWISCNMASLALLNFSKISDVIGKNEIDFFPNQIALEIRRDDLNILKTGTSILNRVEVIPNAYGDLMWVQTNKLPIISSTNGNVIGIIGITRPISEMQALPQESKLFSGTIAFIRANLAGAIKVADLARTVLLSENQFRRKFKEEFGVTPQQFILRARLQHAAHMLRSCDKPISIIANESGFSDQSYLTKKFREFFDLTPLEYRSKWIGR